jgi:predicted flap endonuclease-1-like 5' DNA nuclease
MEYVQCFFLVFAGMLIGYFLWYRDRSGEEQLRLSLERETEDLRTSLKTAHNSNAQLDERFLRQKGQLNVLQQLCDDWSTSREQSERDRAQLEVELEDKRQKYDQTAAEWQAEKELRIGLEDQVHQLSQAHRDEVNRVGQDWLAKHSLVESNLNQRQGELAATAKENQRLGKSLHNSEALIAELRAEMAAKKTLLETAKKNASGLEQEYVSLESSLEESSLLLKQARSECASTMSEKKLAEESMASLRDQHANLQITADNLRSQVAQLETLKPEIESLKQSLAESQDQLSKVVDQRDQALGAEKALATTANGLRSRIDNQESTIHGLREKQKDALEQLKSELQRRTELEAALDQQRSDMELKSEEQKSIMKLASVELQSNFDVEKNSLQNQLAGHVQDVELLKNQREDLKVALEKQRHEMEQKIREQNEQLSTQNNEMQTFFEDEKTQLELQLTKHTESIEHLTKQRDGFAAELDQSRSSFAEVENLNLANEAKIQSLVAEAEELQTTCLRIGELEKLLAERELQLQSDSEQLTSTNQRVESLELQLAERNEIAQRLTSEIESLREQHSVATRRHSELQAQLDQFAASHQQYESAKANHENQLDSLRMKLKASEETIRNLRRERAGVLARLANYRTIAEPDATVISFTQAMEQKKRVDDYDNEYGGHTRNDSVRGLVYTSAPEKTDDLKRISGIASVLEGRLNDYGIYTFKQIMEWKPEAIEEFSVLLAFRDRIERDDWKGQASFFYAEKSKKQAAAA